MENILQEKGENNPRWPLFFVVITVVIVLAQRLEYVATTIDIILPFLLRFCKTFIAVAVLNIIIVQFSCFVRIGSCNWFHNNRNHACWSLQNGFILSSRIAWLSWKQPKQKTSQQSLQNVLGLWKGKEHGLFAETNTQEATTIAYQGRRKTTIISDCSSFSSLKKKIADFMLPREQFSLLKEEILLPKLVKGCPCNTSTNKGET